MDFTWDEDKRHANIDKHGIDFLEAETLFAGPVFTFEDMRRAYGEQRFIGLGLLQNVIVAVAFTEPEDDVIRIISMRKARKHEQRLFFAQLAY